LKLYLEEENKGSLNQIDFPLSTLPYLRRMEKCSREIWNKLKSEGFEGLILSGTPSSFIS
jgi:hypothetical protein